MVARLIEGFEHSTVLADYVGKWAATGGSLTVGTASGRYGNGLRVGGSNNYLSRTFDAQPTWVVGFALRISNFPASSPLALCQVMDGATIHCGLAVQDGSGVLFAWRGTTATVLGTASASLPLNVWTYVEVKLTISDTLGVAAVRLNGTSVLNLTSADTRNAGNASANVVRLGAVGSLAGSYDFDDVYVFDGTGSVNADFAGDCRVERLAPSGAGATTAWTPSAGANYAAVDEAPPNADTDYVSAVAAGATDTYAFGDLVTTSGTVYAVQATAIARKDDAGTRSMALVARPGGTDRVGATQGVGDTYSAFTEVWNTNPDTSAAWTLAEANASQFGLRLIA